MEIRKEGEGIEKEGSKRRNGGREGGRGEWRGRKGEKEGGRTQGVRRGSEGNNEPAVEGGVEGTRGRNGWRRKEAIGKGRQLKEGAGESSVGTGWVRSVVRGRHKGALGKGGEGERGEVCGRNVITRVRY